MAAALVGGLHCVQSANPHGHLATQVRSAKLQARARSSGLVTRQSWARRVAALAVYRPLQQCRSVTWRGFVRRPVVSFRERLFIALALGAVCTFANSSRARDEVPGLLFRAGTVVPPPVITVDAALPTGHRAGWKPRPEFAIVDVNAPGSKRPLGARASHKDGPPHAPSGSAVTTRSCSDAFPVCVHGTQPALRQRALELLTEAYRTWCYVADKPAPLADGTLGGGPELDVYLRHGAELGDSLAPDAHVGALTVELDPPLLLADRSSAWCQLDATRLTARAAALCVAEASAAGIDAAIGPGMRRGWASDQVSALTPADAAVYTGFDDAQREPAKPLLGRESSPRSEAAGAFWAFVDQAWGVAGRGKLPLAMLHMASATTPSTVAHPEWLNVPDELDVLRQALDNDGPRIAEFWTEWAAARAFWGARASGTHVPELRALGAAGRVGFDWVVEYSSLPRHLAGPSPVHPLGSAYVWIELDSVPLHATLAFRAEWEQPVVFTWMIVSVDERGRELNRWRLPYVERSTSAETSIVNFEAGAGLLLIGTNLGAIDASHPLDPDQEPWEPHGYSVYVTQLGP